VLPSQSLKLAIQTGEISGHQPIEEDQVQPASLDLRLGDFAYRVGTSFLPGRNSTVQDKLDEIALHRLDLTQGAVLERGCCYIVPLLESVALKKRVSAAANPKSSTGRLDIFARVITDYGVEFDRVPEGYSGPLYAEISPRTFGVIVRRGSRLVQLRLKRGQTVTSEAGLRRLHEQIALVDADPGPANIKDGKIAFTVDVWGGAEGTLIGYRAKRNAGLIDIDARGLYDPADYWEPLHSRLSARSAPRGLILDPSDFYILATKESVTIPPDYAAEMLAYDTLVGEFRVHYAGFFDPGFGDPSLGAAGTRGVLEVRSHDVPFLVEDGQIVGRLVYERLTARPDKLYGTGIGSSYQRQGLALGKHFKVD
jgi:dCTP deaminase